MDARIDAALEKLQRRDSLLAAVAYALDDVVVAPAIGGRAHTDYRRIYIDPTFIDTLDLDGLVFVLAHECGHIIGHHLSRRQTRDQLRWCYACDMVINREIRGWMPVRDDVPVDESSPPRSEEEIYNTLPETVTAKGDCFTVSSADDTGQVEYRVQTAIEHARQAGTLPGWLLKLEGTDARLPLPPVLRSLLVRGRQEYTWARPSRASAAHDLYLPSVARARIMGTIMVSVDTSGSMTDKEVAKGIGSITRAAKDAHMARLVVVCQDSEATVVYDGPPATYCHRKMRRHGGTDFRPLMEVARRMRPRVLIAITDLEGPHGPKPPCRVLWVTGRSTYPTPPYGTVCRW